MLTKAIREFVLYDDIPAGYYLTLRNLSYTDDPTDISVSVYASLSSEIQGVRVANGTATVVTRSLVKIFLDKRNNSAPFQLSGYLIVDLARFAADNTGAVTRDNATSKQREINLGKLGKGNLHYTLSAPSAPRLLPRQRHSPNKTRRLMA